MLRPFQQLHGPAERLRGDCLAAGAELSLLAFVPAAGAHVGRAAQALKPGMHSPQHVFWVNPSVPTSG